MRLTIKTLKEVEVCPYYIDYEEDCGLCVNKCIHKGDNNFCLIYGSMILNKSKENKYGNEKDCYEGCSRRRNY
jgi:hypothetical protein